MDREDIIEYIQEDIGRRLEEGGYVVEKRRDGIEVRDVVQIIISGGRVVVHGIDHDGEGTYGETEERILLEDIVEESDKIVEDLVDKLKSERAQRKLSYYLGIGDRRGIESVIDLYRREAGALKVGGTASGDNLINALKRGLVPRSIVGDVVDILRRMGYSESRIPKLYREEGGL